MSKSCIACKLDIEEGATKCVHCETSQNWKRHLAFGNTALALLIALISVSAIAIPVIVDVFHTPSSKIRLTLLEIAPIAFHANETIGIPSGESMTFGGGIDYSINFSILLQNEGDRPGILLPGRFDLVDGQRQIASGELSIDGEGRNLLDPGSYTIREVRGVLSERDRELFPEKIVLKRGQKLPPVKVTSGSLNFTIIGNDGTKASKTLQIPASSFLFR